jgi:transposase
MARCACGVRAAQNDLQSCPEPGEGRFIRWSRLGVFNTIFAAIAAKGGKPDQLISDALPKANTLLGDRGYDADWSQGALTAKGIAPCIPSKTNRKIPIPHNPILYPQRHKIENMFGPLKDGRRIQTRYDQCAQTSMSASPSDPTIIA